MKRVRVPQTLDAPPRFLIWEADTVIIGFFGFALGLIMANLTVGCVLAAGFLWMWLRVRAGHGLRRAFARLYWHSPFDVFERVPASFRRHFFG